jgi:hypothetical protein
MMTVFRATFVFFTCFASGILNAQTVEKPLFKEGDKWVYSVRVDENKAGIMNSSTRKWEASISRVGSHTLVLANKAVDSNLPPNETQYNTDWSTTRNVNGKNVVVSNPYDFPMKVGQTWKFDATEEHADPAVKTLRNVLQYTVLGWEDVKVPAGTFKALKIEMEGEWFKEFELQGAATKSAASTGASGATIAVDARAPFTPRPISGRMYKLYWYVPSIKRDVKMIVEDFNPAGGVQHRITEELESFLVQ